MKRSIIPFSTGVTALAVAVVATGCCGPKRDRTTAYFDSGATTSGQYSSTDTAQPHTYTSEEQTSTTPPAPATSERTQVRESVGTATGQSDYSLPLYSETLRVGKREVENGSVRLRKVVRTENASQPVELRREQVVIDREAFDQAQRQAATGQPNDIGAAFQEREITIDLRREEPVVEVTPYVSGRIVAQKRATTDRQTVDRQVRSEHVEVIKNGNDRDIMISERVNAATRNEAVGAPANGAQRQTGTVNQGDSSRQNTDESEPVRRPPQ